MLFDIGRMPPDVLAIWAVLALLALAVIIVAIVAERRWFAARGKAGGWAWVRIASLPIAAGTAAAIFLPARAVGGPEALAAFYALMVTAGPLVWFGLHWLAGLIVHPRLTRAESMRVALSGLLMLLGPALAASMASPGVYELSRTVARMRVETARPAPLPLVVAERGRFAIEGIGELWAERWQVPGDVAIERIDLRTRDDYVQADYPSSIYICRSGPDVHMLWHAAAPPPKWRLYWKGADGRRAQSDWSGSLPPGPATPVVIEWLPDGFALPLRLPMDMLSLAFVNANGREIGAAVRNAFDAGNTDNCMPLRFRRAVTEQQPVITKLHVRFWRYDTQQDLRAIFVRPGEAP